MTTSIRSDALNFGALQVNGSDSVIFDADGLRKDSVQGTVLSDNAPPGKVGEFVSATIIFSGAVITANAGTVVNLTSMILTAGDWDLSGSASFDSPGSVQDQRVGISSVSGTLPSADSANTLGAITGANLSSPYVAVISTGRMRVSIAATTTYYLVVRQAAASGTNKAWGTISARRVR